MKAKEKAKELFDKYYLELREHSVNYDEETAKNCALIAVDTIIPLLFSDYKTQYFWEDVKIEIQNLTN